MKTYRNHPARIARFLYQNPDVDCYEWQLSDHPVTGQPYHGPICAPLITGDDHRQIEREFGPQGGTLVPLV